MVLLKEEGYEDGRGEKGSECDWSGRKDMIDWINGECKKEDKMRCHALYLLDQITLSLYLH